MTNSIHVMKFDFFFWISFWIFFCKGQNYTELAPEIAELKLFFKNVELETWHSIDHTVKPGSTPHY